MAGIDTTGFTPKTTQEIVTDLEGGIRGTFGASEDVNPESVWGQFIGIFAGLLALVWQALGAVYQAAFPDGADGINLDNICALTGIARLPATYSVVECYATGDAGTVIAAGKQAAVLGAGTLFQNVGSLTLVTATAYTPSTFLAEGSIRSFGGKCYRSNSVGTSGTTPLNTPDGSISSWTLLGNGLAYAVGNFSGTTTGPLTAPAQTLTSITTPVSGWSGVINLADPQIRGTNQETDSQLRLRREISLRALGSSTAEAIRSDVSEITNVIDVFVFENDSDAVDASGVPAHSFETVVDGGTNAAVGQAVYNAKGAACSTHGTTQQAVTDSSGFGQFVKFSRPTLVNVWVTVNVEVNKDLFSNNGAAEIKAAIVAWAALEIRTGVKLRASAVERRCWIPGVVDVQTPFIGLAASPATSVTLTPTNRQKLTLDTSRIVVNVT